MKLSLKVMRVYNDNLLRLFEDAKRDIHRVIFAYTGISKTFKWAIKKVKKYE